MRAALEAIPGVRVTRVSVSEQLAVVRYDPRSTTIADLSAALEAAGYKGWDTATEKRIPGGSVRRSPPAPSQAAP